MFRIIFFIFGVWFSLLFIDLYKHYPVKKIFSGVVYAKGSGLTKEKSFFVIFKEDNGNFHTFYIEDSEAADYKEDEHMEIIRQDESWDYQTSKLITKVSFYILLFFVFLWFWKNRSSKSN
jgi:hypothetical protein